MRRHLRLTFLQLQQLLTVRIPQFCLFQHSIWLITFQVCLDFTLYAPMGVNVCLFQETNYTFKRVNSLFSFSGYCQLQVRESLSLTPDPFLLSEPAIAAKVSGVLHIENNAKNQFELSCMCCFFLGCLCRFKSHYYFDPNIGCLLWRRFKYRGRAHFARCCDM